MKTQTPHLTMAVAALAVIAAASAPTKADAATQRELTRLSHDLEAITGDLRNNLQTRFYQTRLHQPLIAEIDLIRNKANLVHRLSPDPFNNLTPIKSSLTAMDQSSHRLQELINLANSGHFGPLHGCPKHLQSVVGSMTNTLQLMQARVSTLRPPAPTHYTGHSWGTRFPGVHPNSQSRHGWGNRLPGVHPNSQAGHAVPAVPNQSTCNSQPATSPWNPSLTHRSTASRTVTFGNGRFTFRIR